MKKTHAPRQVQGVRFCSVALSALCFLGLLLVRAAFLEVFHRHHKQPKGLAAVFGCLGVVSAVRPQNCTRVPAIELTKPRKALMDIHIMNEEIRQAVQRNAHADEQRPGVLCQTADEVKNHAWNGEDQEKTVILFKKAVLFVARLVVVFMPAPQKTVHDVFMCKPRHELHSKISAQCDEQVQQPVSHISCFIDKKLQAAKRRCACKVRYAAAKQAGLIFFKAKNAGGVCPFTAKRRFLRQQVCLSAFTIYE
ncbi:MAG: hypothetical protein RMJ33_11055 [Saprospiraceae bacterium]|nr:hypothetical protein [Saprospiraceae bacterium]MDW8230366.1 hypothetical protein [Saprospiraceae bacterium]